MEGEVRAIPTIARATSFGEVTANSQAFHVEAHTIAAYEAVTPSGLDTLNACPNFYKVRLTSFQIRVAFLSLCTVSLVSRYRFPTAARQLFRQTPTA